MPPSLSLSFISPLPLSFNNLSPSQCTRPSSSNPRALILPPSSLPATLLTLLLTTTSPTPTSPPPLPPQISATPHAPITSDSISTPVSKITPSHPPSTLSPSEKAQLRSESKRHTRASGKLSQKFALARREEGFGHLDSALSLYSDMISDHAEFAPAYSNRANIHAARKEFDAAIADYDAFLDLAPWDNDSWVVWVNRGATRLARGDSARDVLADLNIADEMNSNNDIVLANRAGVWEMLGKWDNASRDYQRALRGNDVRPFWLRYGLVLFEKGKGDEAVAILRRVESRYDQDDVHVALAGMLFERGFGEMAEGEWMKVERGRLWENTSFMEDERKWPPRIVEAVIKFRGNKRSH